jgi:hypothetical protein
MRTLSDGSDPSAHIVGPHIFWRLSADIGLTFDVYLGGSKTNATLAHPRGSDPQRKSNHVPTGGLSIGWSFGQ